MKKIIFDLDIYSHQINCNNQIYNTIYINWMEIGRPKIMDVIGLPFITLIAHALYQQEEECSPTLFENTSHL
jgi:acyl-CoA thioesterase FadM